MSPKTKFNKVAQFVMLIVFMAPSVCLAECAFYSPPVIAGGDLVDNSSKSNYEYIVISTPEKLIELKRLVGGPNIHIMRHKVIENIKGLTSKTVELQSPCGFPLSRNTEYILFLSSNNESQYIHSYLELNSIEGQEMYKHLKAQSVLKREIDSL